MIYYRYVICRGNRVKIINVQYGNSVIWYIANYDKLFRCRLQILWIRVPIVFSIY